jgi:hypothetical protein
MTQIGPFLIAGSRWKTIKAGGALITWLIFPGLFMPTWNKIYLHRLFLVRLADTLLTHQSKSPAHSPAWEYPLTNKL